MTDKNNDIKIYNAEAIERYLQGEMSGAEMHSLELAALEDPFLADAIEGYQNNIHKGPVANMDLEDLRNRLKIRIEASEEKKAIPLYQRRQWKVAAMVFLVAGSVGFVYYLGNKKPLHDTMADTQYKSEEIQPSAADNAVSSPIPSTNSNILLGKEKKTSRKAGSVTYRHKPAVISKASPVPSAAMADIPVKIQPDSLTGLNRVVEVTAATTIPQGIANRSSKVRFYETNQKTSGDSNTTFIDVQDAIPVIGLPGFKEYLELNKKLPPDSLNLHGEVIISFIVNENGSLSGFKIEQSLSKQTDDEAIRLIKEGPAWKLVRNRNAKAVVRMKF